MKPFILELLRAHNDQREWDYIMENFHSSPVKMLGNEPVYEFFRTLDDDLDVNLQPIALSVNPVASFVPYHLHSYVEIIIVAKGGMTILTEDERVELREEDIFIASPNLIHQNLEISKDSVVFNIALKSTAFSNSDLDFLRRSGSSSYLADLLFFTPNTSENGTYTVFHTQPEDGIMLTLANIIIEYYSKQDAQSSQIVRYELLVFFAKLLRISSQNTDRMMSSRKEESNLLPLLNYIETNYASATLEEMGEKFGFNPNYLSSYLKKQTGKSFIKLVHLQRVNVAASYLLYTNASIDQIALKVGYENPSYFYKIFRKIIGTSPKEFRLDNQ